MSALIKPSAWIEKASRIRVFEKLMVDEFGKGNVRGTFHTSYGQELISVILADLLHEDDYVFGNHRSHAIYLALSGQYAGLAAEVLGREGASSAGIGGSQHLNHKNFFTNGIQGGMCSLAVGAAHRNKSISIALIGDGTLGEGALYESLNLASVLKSNTLFILEDNGIAQSTISEFQREGEISKRFESFGIPYSYVDANDTQSLHKEILLALENVRNGLGPFALHIKCNRLGAHSKGDDNRSHDDLEKLKLQDVVSDSLKNNPEFKNLYKNQLVWCGELIDEVKGRANALTICKNFAELLVYGDDEILSTPRAEGKKIKDSIYVGLHNVLSTHESSLLIGEDVEYISKGTDKPYGGAFGVTRDLSEIFPGQVLNSPISESAITGYAIGRALSGRPTIVEIMFGDFVTLTVDAITQQASKIVSMYGKQIPLPMMMRTPTGGRRGYGPTHSQSFEGLFLGLSNLIVYSQNIFSSGKHYLELLNTKLPVIVFENKDLYSIEHYSEPFNYFNTEFSRNNNVLLKPKYKDSEICILTYGFAVNLVISAAEILVEESEVFTSVIIPQIISPLNLDFATEVLKSSKVIYLVEECEGASGLSGLLVRELQRLNINLEIKSISGKGIIGASKISEEESLISTEKIVSVIAKRN
jgi:2-oxoisovalerate dehydrogenase E1 component